MGKKIDTFMTFVEDYTSWNFWVATFYVYMALLSPHGNGDAIILLVAMVLYYMWAKYDLKIA